MANPLLLDVAEHRGDASTFVHRRLGYSLSAAEGSEKPGTNGYATPHCIVVADLAPRTRARLTEPVAPDIEALEDARQRFGEQRAPAS